MAQSINTPNSARPVTPVRSGLRRLGQELGLVVGLALLVFVVLALLSYSPQDAAWSTSGSGQTISNWGGQLGALMADLLYVMLGFSAWWCVAAAVYAWVRAVRRWMMAKGLTHPPAQVARALLPRRWAFWLGLVLVVASSTGLEWSRLHRFDAVLPQNAGGIVGLLGGPLAEHWLGFTGSALLGIVALVLGTSLLFDFSWARFAERVGAVLSGLFARVRRRREQEQDAQLGREAARERDEQLARRREAARRDPQESVLIARPVTQVKKSERVVKEKQKPLFNEMPDDRLPRVDLLDQAPAETESVDAETLEMTSRLIEKKLGDFGVEVKVVAAAPGPVVTRYEIEPATGVKGAQIVNLTKDLARSLSLVSIRVIETIPGKRYMALELPNVKRQMIYLSDILGSQVYNSSRSLLTMGLGKDIVGKPVVANLARMPHLLVAGTTGSGKSVGINAMILSFLYKAEPRDVRLLLIDPKMLEMSVYEGIPHLLAPVVTDMKQAAHGLNWCVGEMERRYKLMSKLGVRNLAGFNSRIAEAEARGEKIGNPFSLTPEEPEPLEHLPQIVIVIDELADLMMVVGKKIEELIARLAQKARAAGIHLILATQRPSVDVITGLIKANIPARISFHVSSKVDSRTILDQMGAEALLGQGDMLYLANGSGLPVRVHGAFVSDEEVLRVVDYLKEQGEAEYLDGVLEGGAADEGGELLGGDDDAEQDPMYDRAVAVVLENNKASISLVQRHLRIGYNRAARLVEAMEMAGLVSSMSSSGKRDVLVPDRVE
ncbi:MAG: DNA translocase FtsK 4TM domain-containing protein [Ottowia sp.]|nr:DNA translocase FtsK 4TM domain-containing protein [Ottowia sp.]